MRFFRIRETPVENITFLAMMVAFDAILSLVATLLPFSGLFIMLVAPLISASVSLFCKKRYIPIYILGAVGISIAVTAWDFMNTLFYLIPAVCTGSLYGFLWKTRLPSSANLFASSVLSFCFFLLSLWLLRLIFDQKDMVEVLLSFIGRGGDPYARDIFPLFALGYSFAQMGITHAFLVYELHKLGVEEVEEGRFASFHSWIAILFLSLSVILGIFYAKVGYFFLGAGIFWMVYSLCSIFPDVRPLTAVLLVFSVFAGVLSFAALYRYMPNQSGLLLLAIPCVLVALFSWLNRFLPKKKAKID